MDNELEMIHHQMEEKRASLADKLDALENQVMDKVQDTTREVTNIVHEVREGVTDVVREVKSTVGTVVDDVKSTVDSVTEGVHDTVESVKETFDFREHIRRHPWLALGGALTAGVAGGYLLWPASRPTRTWEWQPSPPEPRETPASLSNLSAPRREPEPARDQGESTTEHVLSALGDAGTQALSKVRELAVGTLMGVLGEVVLNALPVALKSEVSSLMTDLTTRLGGKVIDFSKGREQTEGAGNGDCNQTEMGRSMGTAQRSDQEPVGQRDRR